MSVSAKNRYHSFSSSHQIIHDTVLQQPSQQSNASPLVVAPAQSSAAWSLRQIEDGFSSSGDYE